MKSRTIGGLLVTNSGNAKVGAAAATYAPITSTCPASCPLRSNGCYAENDKVGFHLRKNVEPMFAGLDGDTLATLEAAAIVDAAPMVPEGHPLRLHVSGDASTPARARKLAVARESWRGPVWTYTHAWRDVPREAWGRVSVLASAESVADAARAHTEGYASAIVVAHHSADGRARVDDATGMRIIPCPAQTRDDVACVDCRLCWDDSALHARKAVIAFEAHGARRKAVRALPVIQ